MLKSKSSSAPQHKTSRLPHAKSKATRQRKTKLQTTIKRKSSSAPPFSSPNPNKPSLDNINHVVDWTQERKHRAEKFTALQSKYVNMPTSPHQEAAGRVLISKYGLQSSTLSNEPPVDLEAIHGVMKLGQGHTAPISIKPLFDTPLSLLPRSLQHKHRMNPSDTDPSFEQLSQSSSDQPNTSPPFETAEIKHNIVVATINGQVWDLQRPIDLSLVPPLKSTSIDPTKTTEAKFDIEYHHADSRIGQQVLWHSTAHILGQAIELEYQKQIPLLSDGPALAEGFFYDVYLHDQQGQPIAVEKSKMKNIAERMNKIIGQKQTFDRLVVTLDDARDVFRYNPFKLEVLDKIEQQQKDLYEKEGPACADMIGVVVLYKCGSFVDLCRGPHVLNTEQCGFTEVFKNSASMLKHPLLYQYKPTGVQILPKIGPDGVEIHPPTQIASVQRIYGVSFPTKQQLDDFKKQKERAEELDHRKLGREQHLFMFHNYSPGSPFWLPHGTRVYNRLVNFLREEYRQRGYNEVRTPQVFDKKLWEISGHWDNYKEDMFFVSKGKLSQEEQQLLQATHTEGDHKVLDDHPHAHHRLPSNVHAHHKLDDAVHHETAQQALKPMNCPGHCVLYDSNSFSYRDLPVRYADFSNLHRNEASGALSGLTRVRCFAQDDAHIFCRPDQLQQELRDALKFIQDVYKTFDFPVYYKLSTRPESYIGDLQTWDNAEDILKTTLNTMEVPWELNEGDGAFYGPKVDITVKDALGRYHQCATMQLDFNLPQRFGLEYKGSDGQLHRPVMIHRAILGSLERFVAVLLEHTEGNLPLWLSPRQVLVTAVSPDCQKYADHVADKLTSQGIYADVANLNERIAKQVKMAQSLKYNYIVTVGAKEIENNTLTLRRRGHSKEEPDPINVDAFVSRVLHEVGTKAI